METSKGVSLLKRTCLWDVHRRSGGNMVDFAGWEMPVHYSGTLDEHGAVRDRAGIFDVSHMGRVQVSGAGAREFLQRTLSNNVDRLVPGAGQYTLALNERGGVRDDLIIFRLEDGYLVIVNASNLEKILGHFRSLADSGTRISDRSGDLGMIAFQGPRSEGIASRLAPGIAGLARFGISEMAVAGMKMLVSRTGYTGEDGFELYPASSAAPELWDALLAAGKPEGVLACGLGARDILRLEMGYSLYGHEIDEDTNPFDARIGWAVKMDKGEFIGRAALEAAKTATSRRKLAGFTCKGAGVPRQGYELTFDGRPAGVVTSGTYSPRLQKGIGLGYLKIEGKPEGAFAVTIRGKSLPLNPADPPFYKGGSVRGPGKS